ncbi:MAG TPA: hypothetical protein VHP33_26905 [Polyangiaceae bacterium]|nr:hypothetical protein [Polyangiaceae bacterium]
MTAWPYARGDETAFSCPTCASLAGSQPLRATEGAATCLSCGRQYPVLGGVACLVPDPERFRFQQLRNLQDYELFTTTREREIGVERGLPHLLELTRGRLLQLMRAMEFERNLVGHVLAPLVHGLDAEAARLAPGAAAPVRELRVLEMYETIFRDWAWGDAESERALSQVMRLAAAANQHAGVGTNANAGFGLGKLAVFGAGACRLAADVQRTLEPTATYALDCNPLPLFIAERVLSGAVLRAYEYPTGPRGLAQTAVLQRLHSPFPAPEGLLLALADARRPPFAAGSLDSVLTPWFIDVVAADLPETIATLGQVLRTGGLWLNQGPLRFGGSASRRYSIEEVHELARAGGFELVAELNEDVPYFDSPHAGARRLETVYGFAARKLRTVPARTVPAQGEPAWAVDVAQPIPALPELGALQERLVFSAGALSLIDGARSITDLAEALGAELGIEPRRLLEPLRGLLLTLLVTG